MKGGLLSVFCDDVTPASAELTPRKARTEGFVAVRLEFHARGLNWNGNLWDNGLYFGGKPCGRSDRIKWAFTKYLTSRWNLRPGLALSKTTGLATYFVHVGTCTVH
jgi:hypothetical protein